MNRNPQPRSPLMLLLVPLLALAASVAPAQEEAQEDEGHKIGSVRLELEGWIAQPAGLEYVSATVADTTNDYTTRQVGPSFGTESEFRYRVHYDLPKKFGTFVGTYYVHGTETDSKLFSPGSFIYGAQLIDSPFVGVNDDGLADGFIAQTYTRLREERLDFVRPAFRSAHASGDWSIGWRRVSHARRHDVTYFPLVPDLPSLIPPVVDCEPNCPDLSPSSDIVSVKSDFRGRGPTAGLDVDFPVWQDKLMLEGGIAYSVLRGKTDASYGATEAFYVIDMQTESQILEPPFAEFAYFTDSSKSILCETRDQDSNGDGLPDCGAQPLPASDSIREIEARYGFLAESESTTSDVLEINLGFRWQALKWLEVTGGFRSARYTDVGLDLEPSAVLARDDPFRPEDQIGLRVDDVRQTRRSVTYEGFYVGVIVRVF